MAQPTPSPRSFASITFNAGDANDNGKPDVSAELHIGGLKLWSVTLDAPVPEAVGLLMALFQDIMSRAKRTIDAPRS